MSPPELAQKNAVVTGSSQGIGRAIALELARGGANVLIHAGKRADRAQAVAKEIEALGGKSIWYAADLRSPDGCAKFVETAYVWRDDIHIWVNCAGVDVLTGEARDWSFEQKLQRLWEVDVAATMRLSRQVGRQMIASAKENPAARQDYTILNIGWDQAQFGMGGDSGEMFSAIKGAVMAFSKSLAISLAPHVRVNCIAPGWIRTSWGETAPAYWADRAVGESLMQRWGTPEDVAAAARFLCSPAASFITGQVLPVNGGFRHGR